jgi:hypothetical protein
VHPAARRFFDLPKEAKRRVQVDLCRRALTVWEEHVRLTPDLSYVEGVVGTRQEVDGSLPRAALEVVAAMEASPAVAERYLEPITALNDRDLELPEPVEYAYCAVYNLFRKYAGGSDVDDWLIVNQALSAYPQERWFELLEASLTIAG